MSPRDLAAGIGPPMFSSLEIAYLRSKRLARLATVSPAMQADVSPAVFELGDDALYAGGFELPRTPGFENVRRGRTKVALVVDDFESVDPWKPRGIKVHGHASIVERSTPQGARQVLRIVPTRVWSWGIESPTLDVGRATPATSRPSARG